MEKVRAPEAGSAFSYWEPFLAEWGVNMSEEEFWNYWFGAESPSEDMIAIAKSLKDKGLKVITLSNNFKERANFYGHYPWMSNLMDQTYFSWKTGFVKPNPDAWKNVLSDFSLTANEVVYFDDQEKNLEAARSLGIESFMFSTPEKVLELVQERL
jgi:putative hydrolase of the HAD superfamily